MPDFYLEDNTDSSFKRNEVAINLPWLINGAPDIPISGRITGEQMFARMKVHKGEILDHLYKIFRAILLASQERDFEFLEEYCEEMFYTKLRNRLN